MFFLDDAERKDAYRLWRGWVFSTTSCRRGAEGGALEAAVPNLGKRRGSSPAQRRGGEQRTLQEIGRPHSGAAGFASRPPGWRSLIPCSLKPAAIMVSGHASDNSYGQKRRSSRLRRRLDLGGAIDEYAQAQEVYLRLLVRRAFTRGWPAALAKDEASRK